MKETHTWESPRVDPLTRDYNQIVYRAPSAPLLCQSVYINFPSASAPHTHTLLVLIKCVRARYIHLMRVCGCCFDACRIELILICMKPSSRKHVRKIFWAVKSWICVENLLLLECAHSGKCVGRAAGFRLAFNEDADWLSWLFPNMIAVPIRLSRWRMPMRQNP